MTFRDKEYGEAKIFSWDNLFAYQKHDLLLSQRKYTLDLLEETSMLGVQTC